MIEGEVQIKPLSSNRAWQGRRFSTPEKKRYEEAVLLSLQKPQDALQGDLELELVFYLKHPKMSDVDNLIKVNLDCLVKKGYLKDDRQVVSLLARKERSAQEGWRFRLVTLE